MIEKLSMVELGDAERALRELERQVGKPAQVPVKCPDLRVLRTLLDIYQQASTKHPEEIARLENKAHEAEQDRQQAVNDMEVVERELAEVEDRLKKRRDWFADVLEFHRKFGCYVGDHPKVPDQGTADLRIELLREEFEKCRLALSAASLPDIADGILDLIYVALGLLVSYGIDARPIWAAIHEANMAKEGGATRSDGKILKPPGWKHPPIAMLLEQQRVAAEERKRRFSAIRK